LEDPTDPKLIREHSKTSAPERIKQWHRDLAFFAECSEKSLNSLKIFTVDGDRKIVALFISTPTSMACV
jgi:hypothetical protein